MDCALTPSDAHVLSGSEDGALSPLLLLRWLAAMPSTNPPLLRPCKSAL